MSAVHQLEYPAAPVRRRHLRALPDMPQVETVPVEVSQGRRSRIMRRRRFAAALVLLVVVGGAFLAGRALADDAAPTRPTVTVRSGETLSGIAARVLPAMPNGDGVAALQRANDLGSLHVDAGETLVVPAQ